MSNKNKKIVHYINKYNGEVHCYFENKKDIKYSYDNKFKWEEIIRDSDWVEKEVKNLKEKMGENDYIKITHIYNNIKHESIKNKSNIVNDFLKWNIPISESGKEIFKLEIIKPKFKDLFLYYFDPYFYKEIQGSNDDKLDEEDLDQITQIMEYYMEKTRYEIFCKPLSISLNELFKGESHVVNPISNISFLHSRFNLSQFEGIEKSLTYPTTIIKGPPGTGKTTTLLNIIISAFLNGKTVLVASKNNEGVNNVLELLKKYNFNKFWFRFGNNAVLANELEKTRELHFKNSRSETIKEETFDVYKRLKDLIMLNNEQNEMKESLRQWQSLRMNHLKKANFKGININFNHNVKILFRKYKFNLFNYLFWFLLPSKNKKAIKRLNYIKTKLYKDEDTIPIITNKNFDNMYFDIKEDILLIETFNSINKMIAQAQKSIKNINFQKEWDKIKGDENYYKHVFSNIVKYIDKANKTREDLISEINKKSVSNNFNIRKECYDPVFIKKFMQAFPVHFVTNLSIYKLPDIKYDYVILDEAGQSDIQSTIGLLQKGRHNILCGDEKQLEPIYKMTKKEDDNLAGKYGIDSFFKASENSMLNIYSNFFSNDRIAFLNEHYRCPPNVIKFSNTMFYDDKLVIKTESNENGDGISLIDVNGVVDSKCWINHDEIDAIIADIKNNQTNPKNIAVISPFRDQVNAMKERRELKGIEVDTVYKFQGRELDVIYFSSVIGQRMNFGGKKYLNKPSLINVALTRTKKNFILVSNKQEIQKHAPHSLIGRLQIYISEKKYLNKRNTKDNVNKIWSENIVNNSSIKLVNIKPLFQKLKSICDAHFLELAINVRFSDVFNINKRHKNFFDVVDYVVYDKDGKIQHAIVNNNIIYTNDSKFLLLGLQLEENIINLPIKRILTKNELSFMKILKEALSEDEILMPSVKLDSVVNLNKQKNISEWMRKSAEAMHFDFVVYKKNNNTLVPIKVIELDDITHTRAVALSRDKRKDWFASLAKIKIKRFISYKY